MGDLVIFVVLWIVLSLVAEWALGLAKAHTLYYIIASQGFIAEKAFNFLATWLTPVFVFVVLFLIFTLIRFHAPDGKPVKSSQQTMRNMGFTIFWVGLSFALNIMFFLHPTSSDLEQMFSAWEPARNRGDLVVDVTARQWEWIYTYPQYGIKQAVNNLGEDELELPVDRKVKFVLRSYDPFHTYDVYAGVIHDFWIPAFGMKEAVVPGLTRYEYIRPMQIASYQTNPMVRVQCAEVCGPGHPWMESPVNIVSTGQFARWIKLQQKLQAQAGS
ncbi:MAG: cytochrome C oxidase subunit II [Sulfobacillus benefaciens]|uniref:cytochrome-c oxidase n=1 Tax=Sulfobacillus benefaciens TaxID=453960 RepID=A0A2T2X5D6_9FIRM|nr:MAG: cytochrome C oxidase subunit II [Sulfobacillus benefaciens]